MTPGYSTQHRVGSRRGGSSKKWTPLATSFCLWLITPYASFGFRQILPCPVSLTVCFQSDRSIQSDLSWSCSWVSLHGTRWQVWGPQTQGCCRLSTTHTIIFTVAPLQGKLHSTSTPDTGEASRAYSVKIGYFVIHERQGWCWQKARKDALKCGLLIFLLVENLGSWEMLTEAARSLPLALEGFTGPIPASASSLQII